MQKYNHVLAFYHRLSWLPGTALLYLFYTSVSNVPPVATINLSVFHWNHHLFLVELLIIAIRTPAYFAIISMFRLSFPQRFFTLKLHMHACNGGIYYHPL